MKASNSPTIGEVYHDFNDVQVVFQIHGHKTIRPNVFNIHCREINIGGVNLHHKEKYY